MLYQSVVQTIKCAHSSISSMALQLEHRTEAEKIGRALGKFYSCRPMDGYGATCATTARSGVSVRVRF